MYTLTVIICSLLVHLSYSQDSPSANSRLGNIKGHYKVSNSGNKYEAYEGIPYALPPTGNRRFMPPEPIRAWQEPLKADKFRKACIGHARLPEKISTGDYIMGVEDCLYLNVYTPVKKTNVSVPVIFWIYGGAFQYSTLEGTEQDYLMDHDVIFVSVNYRHGSLGFLSTEDEVVAGNMGLKDQALALEWVSENIEYFGGDPQKITLIGLSAGGASVHYHYLSKMSAGLFRSGISLSGTAFDSWTQAKSSRSKAIRLGQLLNCSTADVNAMVNCLRTRPARAIVEAQAHFMPWILNEFTPFGPVVEKNSRNPFIDRSPIDIINSGDAYDVPWITGVVSEEGIYPVAEFATNKTAFEDLNENWDTIAPHLLQYYYSIPKENHATVARKIRNHYFGDQPITQENILTLTHLYSDRVFVVDAEKAARVQAKISRSPVYFYYYSYRATDSLSDYLAHAYGDFGVSHGDDVLLVLFTSKVSIKKSARDFAMHQTLTRFWLSVVRDSVPNFGPKWMPINPGSTHLTYLHMKDPSNFREETNDNLGERLFWQTIDFNENKPSQTV